MTIHVRCVVALLLPLAACSLPTQGRAPNRDSGVFLDGAVRADSGDGCVSTTEICNGRDDDCDGTVDEGCDCTPGDLRACGSDMGACVAGTETCEAAGWSGRCVGEVGPATEVCNGLDDDCNGTVDEGCDCAPGASRACGSDVGACSAGTQTCTTAGAWSDCTGSVGPDAEVCEGSVDEDCDGMVDNGCACTNDDTQPCPGGTNQGACDRGTQTCTAGAWAACVGRVTAVSEVCDGSVDDDCDGMVDNGCLCTNGDTRPCGVSAGACTPGTQTCASGAWGSCSGGVGPSAEVCDGVDNNCDGSIDEGGVCVLPGCTWAERGGHAYLLCNPSTGLTWDEAALACGVPGYHLVRIESDAENTWIRDRVGGSGDWWIGLTDRATEDTFLWTDGGTACNRGKNAGPPYCHWRGGRPNGGSAENCVRMEADRGSGEWNDRNCSTRFAFVCEAP
ncbi:MAG: C-type lectin domain-containing protein [Deltaproteobacteria bacterium]|nr:C-type lectin domain-containing protein [Deltaproteobacteria bacterium]